MAARVYLPSSSGPMLGILLQRRQLAVRLSHKCLQLFFKQLVGSLWGSALHRSGTHRTLVLIAVAAAEFPTRGILSLGLGLQTLDGQVDLTVFRTNNHDLHILPLGQVLADVIDIGIGHFRDMYHAGLILGQSHKGSEIGDGLDFSF